MVADLDQDSEGHVRHDQKRLACSLLVDPSFLAVARPVHIDALTSIFVNHPHLRSQHETYIYTYIYMSIYMYIYIHVYAYIHTCMDLNDLHSLHILPHTCS